MSNQKGLSIHQIAVFALWAFSIAVVGLLVSYLIARQNFSSSASETVADPDETVTVAAGQTSTFNGVGAIRIKCGNTLFSQPAAFSATATLDAAARGGVSNYSSSTRGTSALVRGLNKWGGEITKTILPGKNSGYLYPGTLTTGEGSIAVTYPAAVTSGVTYTNCDVVMKGNGNAAVTASGLTALTVGVYYKETSLPIATADDPIPLQTTIHTDKCSIPITVKGAGAGPTGNEQNQVVSNVETPESTQTGTINGYNTYRVTVTDSATGATKSARVDKNKDSKLEVNKKCDGTLTIKQPAKPAE